MNNKVKFLRGTSNENTAAEKDNDAIYFTTDNGKLYIGDKEVSGDGSITVDNALSDTSTNPVQNKVIKQAIDNKANKSLYGDTTINVGRKAETDVGDYSTAEGYETTASGNYSHTEGYNTIASGIGSHAEGSNYSLSGVPSSRKVTISNGEESTIYTIGGSYAYGINSHAEGTRSFAYGSSSHAEGCDTTASGAYSHAEGRDTTASGTYSHAEGDFITASGAFSHAEGNNTTASGNCSHAEGCRTTAGGRYSHAGGYYTKALKVAEFAHGQYNQSNDNTLFSIGDGTADDARHNAFEITTTGGKLHDKDIATTDLIPTTLPANGGNADTAKTLSEWGRTPTLNLDNVDFGFIAASDEANSAPNTFWSTVLTVGQSIQTYAAQLAFPWSYEPSQAMKYRALSNGVWSDWKEISTTPIKSTTFSANVDGTGNFNLWAPSENKVPISIRLDNKTFYAVPFLYNNQMWLGSTINEVTRQPVANTTVSGTVYYIEV